MDSETSRRIGPGGQPPTVVYFIDGTKFYMHFEPVSKFFLDPAMVRFFLVSWVMWIILQNGRTNAIDSEVPSIFIYFSLGIIVLCTMILATLIAIRVTRLFGPSFIYTPMVSIPIVLVHDLSEWLMLRFFLPGFDLTMVEFLLRLLQNFVAFSLLDYFYGHFVAPLMDKGVAIPANKPAPKASNESPTPEAAYYPPQISKPAAQTASAETSELPLTLMLQGEIVQTSALFRVDAEDHYIRIFEGSCSKLVRGKFADAMKQIPEHLGIQISRSQWIGCKHIAQAERSRTSKLFLKLNDGEVVQVARSRRRDAETKLAQWTILITYDAEHH